MCIRDRQVADGKGQHKADGRGDGRQDDAAGKHRGVRAVSYTHLIVSIWNRKGTIFEGYHTFAVQKWNGEWMVYNRFNKSAESTEKKTMGEVIENGQFIVGYRVQNAK